LTKEDHLRLRQPEISVLPEVTARRFVIRVTRHDQPRDRRAITTRSREDLLREHLKQRPALHRRHPERSFRPIVSETRSLAARNRERRHFTRPQRFFPPLPRRFPTGLLFRPLRQRLIRCRTQGGEIDANRSLSPQMRPHQIPDLV